MDFETLLFLLLLLATAAIPLALIWRWKKPADRFRALCGLVGLLMGIAIWQASNHSTLPWIPIWLTSVYRWVIFFLPPGLGVICAARLLSLPERAWLNGLLAVLLVALVGPLMFFTSLWDVATDGVGGPFLKAYIGLVTLLSVGVMVFRAPGARKALALIILIGVPLVMAASDRLASHAPDGKWGRMPPLLTERNAVTIQNAILRYHARTGSYPAQLSDLTPRELLLLPRQYILPGMDWCYAGDEQGYRFAYRYREYFSAPQSLRIVAEQGSPPEEDWSCPTGELYDFQEP